MKLLLLLLVVAFLVVDLEAFRSVYKGWGRNSQPKKPRRRTRSEPVALCGPNCKENTVQNGYLKCPEVICPKGCKTMKRTGSCPDCVCEIENKAKENIRFRRWLLGLQTRR